WKCRGFRLTNSQLGFGPWALGLPVGLGRSGLWALGLRWALGFGLWAFGFRLWAGLRASSAAVASPGHGSLIGTLVACEWQILAPVRTQRGSGGRPVESQAPG